DTRVKVRVNTVLDHPRHNRQRRPKRRHRRFNTLTKPVHDPVTGRNQQREVVSLRTLIVSNPRTNTPNEVLDLIEALSEAVQEPVKDLLASTKQQAPHVS